MRKQADMSLTRLTLVTAQVLVAIVLAALLGAAYAGSTQASGPPSRHLVGLHTTPHPAKPIYPSVVYHPHQMCDELRHPAMRHSTRS